MSYIVGSFSRTKPHVSSRQISLTGLELNLKEYPGRGHGVKIAHSSGKFVLQSEFIGDGSRPLSKALKCYYVPGTGCSGQHFG